MLKLFKKVLKSKFPDSKASVFWIYTLSEFIIVILGILIALKINNWNNERKNRELERIFLNEFKVNLSNDLKDISINIELLGNVLNSNTIIDNYLNCEMTFADSLNSHFGYLYNVILFVNDVSAYESVKSIGLDLIRNNELREKITYLYSGRYSYILKLQELHLMLNQDFLFPAMIKELNNYVPLVFASPNDSKQIKESTELKSFIKMNITSLTYQIAAYKSVKKTINEINELIDKELE